MVYKRNRWTARAQPWDHDFALSCMCGYCVQLREAYEERFPDLRVHGQGETTYGPSDTMAADLFDLCSKETP